MTYDKKTGTITISSDDPKDFERDIFKHFEEVTRQLAQDPNCPREILAEHQKLKKANKAFDDYEKLISLTEQVQAIKKAHANKNATAIACPSDKAGATMKWTAISLNVLLLLAFGYLFATKGAPREEELFLVIILLAAPLVSLIALTKFGGESWLGLYFKRKALEEKQRIRNLESSGKRGQAE
jgi:hypothetical protein